MSDTIETLAPFPHPETGEPLESQADFQAALVDVENRLTPLYRSRYAIREAMFERYDPVLPQNPRNRTVAQALVARCPRCRKEFSE